MPLTGRRAFTKAFAYVFGQFDTGKPRLPADGSSEVLLRISSFRYLSRKIQFGFLKNSLFHAVEWMQQSVLFLVSSYYFFAIFRSVLSVWKSLDSGFHSTSSSNTPSRMATNVGCRRKSPVARFISSDRKGIYLTRSSLFAFDPLKF